VKEMAKRGRKSTKERKGYFYEKEETALVEYLKCEDQDKKEEIFNTTLKPALTKMVESIIRRYKLYTPDEEYQDTFDDTMSFLMSKIEHFNVDSGYKAYSYCGTVCKNYLILKINKYNKNLTRTEQYETMKAEIEDNEKYSYLQDYDRIQEINDLIQETINTFKTVLDEREKHQLTDNEYKVGLALVSLMENWEDMFARMGSNKFNKSSILMYITELTLLPLQDVRKSMKRYKSIYKTVKEKSLTDIY
jgi:hypothetical protein